MEDTEAQTSQQNELNMDSEEPKRKLRIGRVLLTLVVLGVLVFAIYAFMNPSVSIISSLAIFSSGDGDGDTADVQSGSGEIAAVVNGEEISLTELDEQYEQVPEAYRSFVTKESILDQMITEKILLQEAEANDIFVSNAEVDEFFEEFIEQSGQTPEEFQESLEARGLTMQEMRDYYKSQLLITKLINDTILMEIVVTEDDAETYFEENEEMYQAQEGQIRARHILVETEEEAEEIIEELKDGADFVELAKEKSIGPSGPSGGELGFFAKGEMVPEFEEAAFKLKVGEVSAPVETQFGFHVIKRESNEITFDDVKDSIEEVLLYEKQKTAVDIYITQLKNKANILLYYKEPNSDEIDDFDDSEAESDEEPFVIEVEDGVDEAASDDEDSSEVEDLDVSCIGDYGLKDDTIVYYYLDSDKCSQCQEMLPIVEELEAEGFELYYAEVSDKSSLDVIDACFSDIVEGKVPLFICAGSRETKLGKYSKSTLEQFMEKCVE
ncbi:peptidylprolyl isomerase [Candidatus Woesearchaeota archaeon]|nr:peptidylprolyl isomerase [Candidatus Woesearchaeota archaeon]